MDLVLFGERLANAREAAGMSRKSMANRLGVKQDTVEAWEGGERAPRANRLQMMASLLNVPLMWLLAGSQDAPDPTGGLSNRDMMLQKIADLGSQVDAIRAALDDLETLAKNGS